MNDHHSPRFVYLLSRARHQLMRELDRTCQADAGISATQIGALFALREMDGCQLKELSRVLGVDNSAVTGLVQRLVHAGVVKKRRSTTDGRAFELCLTAHGRRVADNGLAALDEVNARLMAGFSQQELKTAARFLQAVIDRFPNQTEEQQP